MTYDEWNDLLLLTFFKPAMAGKRVRLNITRQLLDELGHSKGDNAADFVQAVREGHGLHGVSLCLRAVHALELWHQRHILVPRPKYPQYFGYLCFFVFAVGEGDFNEAAYYPRLRRLLGEPEETGMYPHIEKTLAIWMDLQNWANRFQRGACGLFQFVRRGNHPYVSVPRAQVLLSTRERQKLHRVFFDAGIDPDRRPSRNGLAFRLREFGLGILSASVLRLLGQAGDFREYLLDDVEDELDQFEPTEIVVQDTRESAMAAAPSRSRCADLQIGLTIEPPRVKCRARFLLNAEVAETDVEAGLLFSNRDGPAALSLTCGGRFPGWSSILEVAPGVPWDAATWNWAESLELCGQGSSKLKLRLEPRGVRIFISGLPEGLPGLIETASLPSYGECFLAVSPDNRIPMQRWGHSLAAMPQPCPLREIPVKTGLPTEWSLFQMQSVPSCRDLILAFPGESGSETVRVLLHGGIRAPGQRSRYFSFAPPRVVLSGDCSGIEVTLGEHKWNADSSGVFSFPENLSQPGQQLTICIWRDQAMLATRQIQFVEDGEGCMASDVHALFGRDGALITTLLPDDAFAGCKITEKPTVKTAPIVPPVTKLDPSAVAILCKQIQDTFKSGENGWSDPGGNRFVILHRFETFSLNEIKDRTTLPVTLAAIKAAGLSFHELRPQG